jgi:hypothetical protein
MLVLDLFSGTKSLKKFVDNKQWDYLSLDIEPKHNPDILIDFLEWDYKTVNPDILWASPDCAVYSMASGSKHFGKDKEPKTEKAKTQLRILEKLKECIEYYTKINSNFIYFIENPTARMVWFIKEYPRYDVSYCKYGFDRMKPTTIWTNKKNFIPKKCKNGATNCNHIRAPRGSKTGTQAIKKFERYKVPEQLINELLTI